METTDERLTDKLSDENKKFTGRDREKVKHQKGISFSLFKQFFALKNVLKVYKVSKDPVCVEAKRFQFCHFSPDLDKTHAWKEQLLFSNCIFEFTFVC